MKNHRTLVNLKETLKIPKTEMTGMKLMALTKTNIALMKTKMSLIKTLMTLMSENRTL